MHIAHHFSLIKEAGGGVPRAVLDLVGLLAGTGEKVTILTADGSDLPRTWSSGGDCRVRVIRLEPVSRPFQFLTRQGLKQVREALETVDLVHLHGLWRPRNHQIAKIAVRMKLPYVISPHGMLNAWGMAQSAFRKRVYYTLFERWNLSNAAAVLFSAARERDSARKRISHDRLAVIPLAVDLELYRDISEREFARTGVEIAPDLPVVLMLGRLHPSKRPDLLIDAFTLMADAGRECQLFFAGEGDPAYVEGLRDHARRSGNAHRIQFLGMVSGREKVSLYRRADVFAMPTKGENFGLVLFESMACATPVITTDGADTAEEIAASGGGRIVKPTADSFARNIVELLDDRELRLRMGEMGRAWVLERLNPQKVIQQYQRVYSQARQGAYSPPSMDGLCPS